MFTTARRGIYIGLAITGLALLGFVSNLGDLSFNSQAQSGSLGFYSCPMSNFLPANTSIGYQSTTPPGTQVPTADYRNITSVFGGTLLCGVNVPEGALLQSVKFVLFSGSATGLPVNVDCFLKRLPLQLLVIDPKATNIAQAASLPVIGRTVATATINPADATVDNENASYYVSCAFPPNNTNVGIVGASVAFLHP